MKREEIIDALTALGEVLHGRGVTGEMYMVGGAAIALAFDERRSTRDIDAVFEPKEVVYEAAAEVAARLGLPAAWLNDAVKGFLVPDPHPTAILDVPGLRCQKHLRRPARRRGALLRGGALRGRGRGLARRSAYGRTTTRYPKLVRARARSSSGIGRLLPLARGGGSELPAAPKSAIPASICAGSRRTQ